MPQNEFNNEEMTPNKAEALAALVSDMETVENFVKGKGRFVGDDAHIKIRDLAQAIRAFINAQDGWEPIESVPADEDVIFYNFYTGVMCFGRFKPGWVEDQQWQADNYEVIDKPTHWKLPPVAPASPSETEKGGE